MPLRANCAVCCSEKLSGAETLPNRPPLKHAVRGGLQAPGCRLQERRATACQRRGVLQRETERG